MVVNKRDEASSEREMKTLFKFTLSTHVNKETAGVDGAVSLNLYFHALYAIT